MRRIETYVGQQIYEWAFSAQAQYGMTAIAKVCGAMFGTSGLVNGLACTPTGPATMAVQIGPGELYQNAPLEATTCGTLPADTSHTILKQGIQLGTITTATFAAPVTSGQSIAYLIEIQYQDSDISLDPTSGASPVVLQFYNSSNPATPWSGPNNSGATSNTFRDGVIAYQIKAGVAATTGTQVTPSPDTGWIGLWVVTVPFGASSLTSGNISQYSAAPILPTGMLQSILTSNLTYGIDNGTTNVIQATFPIPVTTLTDQMNVWVKVKNANTGATTFTPNPGVIAPAPVVGAAHAALQGGEYVAGGRAQHVWRQDISSWVLVECTGGALQIAPATQSQHAVPMAQAAGVVGTSRNVLMNIATASASATLTADEIVVETALGGVRYCLPSFNKTINLATTGAGGMDTGSAPASGFVAIYAIWNPSTSTAALLATNATSAAAPSIYGGANMPSGYTASALVSVWPTNASSQFVTGLQTDRHIGLSGSAVTFTTSTVASTPTSFSIAGKVPKNARRASGQLGYVSTASPSGMNIYLMSDANLTDLQQRTGVNTNSVTDYTNFVVSIGTPQTLFYQSANGAGTPTFSVIVSGYDF